MEEEKKIQYEKFAALLALETQNGKIGTKKELENRADLLSSSITGRHFRFSNIKEEVTDFININRNGRGISFKITPDGERAIYQGKNSQTLVHLLGKAIKSVGKQFSSYGSIAEKLNVDSSVPKEIPFEVFSETLEEAISKKTTMSGWAKIEDVKKYVCGEMDISKEQFSDLCRKVASNNNYDFAPGRKGEKITLNGKVYGLIRRGGR